MYKEEYFNNWLIIPNTNNSYKVFKGLTFQIQNKMPTYTIYNLQHVIYLATQIESQIETHYQRNLDDVIKRLDEIKDLIKE